MPGFVDGLEVRRTLRFLTNLIAAPCKQTVPWRSEGERYHRVERTFGEFRRSVRLPRDVQRDNIAAEYTDGVLHVELPKAQPKSARKIEIRGQHGAAKTDGPQAEASQASS